MASVVYSRFFLQLALGNIDWDTDDIRVALVDATYTPNKDNTYWTTGTDPGASEVTGDAYTAGGAALSGGTATQDDTNDLVKLDGADVAWQTSTISAKAAVVYDSTLGGKDLIACYEFTETKSSANGTFTIQFSSSGMMELKQGA